MNSKKDFVIVIMAGVIMIIGAVSIDQHAQWQQLKTIDDQKIAVDQQAMTACVEGWTATTDLNIPALTKATDDLTASRKINTEVLKQRSTQLKKLGY